MDCTDESLLELVFMMRARLAAGETTIVLRVLDPDLGRGCYPGERVEHGGREWVHRPFRVWVDLAERLGLRLLTPRALGDGRIELRFEVLDRSASWQLDEVEDPTDKYGVDSGYARISKLEDPELVLDVADALDRIDPKPGARILDIGVNTGDEIALIGALRPELRETAEFVGIDHSRSALEVARGASAARTIASSRPTSTRSPGSTSGSSI
jgi:hypothetical protein